MNTATDLQGYTDNLIMLTSFQIIQVTHKYFTYGDSQLPRHQQIQNALQNLGSAHAELHFEDTPEVPL